MNANTDSLVDLWLVHCAGKVASVSITQALAVAGLASGGSCVLKTHVLNRANLDRAIANSGAGGHLGASVEFLDRLSAADFKHCCVIVGRRDPVAQAVSTFFQNILQFTGRDVVTEADRSTVEECLRKHISKLIDFNTRAWWREELDEVFGLSVLDFEFDRAAGISCTRVSDSMTFVVYNVERGLQHMAGILEALSGRRPITIPFVNTASDTDHHKPYANRDEIGRLYGSVRDAFRLPAEPLESVYAQRSCTHFYDERQIAAFKAKWCE